MTPDQMDIALAFDRVSFCPGTSIKFAAKTFLAMAQGPGREADLSILQEEYLYLIAIRFRRQMPARYVAMATKQLAMIKPLVDQERATRKREAEDRQAKRAAVKRAKERLQGHLPMFDLLASLTK